MEKKLIRVFDENWNLENEGYVEILTDEEKAQREKEQRIKDYLYSNPILRLYGSIMVNRRD